MNLRFDEIKAFKPGNVNLISNIPGLSKNKFYRAAQVSSESLTNLNFTFTFVRILKKGTMPELSKVQNTNFCDIGVFKNENTVVVHSAIDNLIKGAAGQAIQCLNLMIGEKEEYILE